MTPLNGDPTRWDEHGKREVPSDVYDGTGEAGGDTLREALADIASRQRETFSSPVEHSQWCRHRAKTALNLPTESVKAPEGVMQTDRDAGAALMRCGRLSLKEMVAVDMEEGRADDSDVVQAFMRHRLAAAPASITPNDAVAKEREWLIEASDYLISLYDRLWKGGVVRDLAEAMGEYDAAKAAIRSSAPDAGEAATDAASGGGA